MFIKIFEGRDFFIMWGYFVILLEFLKFCDRFDFCDCWLKFFEKLSCWFVLWLEFKYFNFLLWSFFICGFIKSLIFLVRIFKFWFYVFFLLLEFLDFDVFDIFVLNEEFELWCIDLLFDWCSFLLIWFKVLFLMFFLFLKLFMLYIKLLNLNLCSRKFLWLKKFVILYL